MPIDYKNYPDNWKTEIRPATLKRAGNKCENCGAENYGLHPETRAYVVLTIAHYDHNIKNNRYSKTNKNAKSNNLFAWCQLCHNRHDVEHRKQSKVQRKRKLMES